jgi:hypothetical protein
MKKLLFICLMLTGLALQAQDRKVITTIYTGAIVDSTTTLTLDGNYAWGVQCVWLSGSGTLDGTVEILVSNSATANFIRYDTNSFKTIDAAIGNWAFESDNLPWKYLRCVIANNNMTGATITVTLVKQRK